MMNSTMISYTPINELPMPPQWMLDELEEEFMKYNTYLMSRIFTIREARPIRNAFRKKFKTHPVAKLLKEKANLHFNCYGDVTTLYQYARNFSSFVSSKGSGDERAENKHYVPKNVTSLPKGLRDNMKFKRGKNTGVYKSKSMYLADKIVITWKYTTNIRRVIREDNGYHNIDKLLKKGFVKYFDENWERNKTLAARDYCIREY